MISLMVVVTKVGIYQVMCQSLFKAGRKGCLIHRFNQFSGLQVNLVLILNSGLSLIRVMKDSKWDPKAKPTSVRA